MNVKAIVAFDREMEQAAPYARIQELESQKERLRLLVEHCLTQLQTATDSMRGVFPLTALAFEADTKLSRDLLERIIK